MQLEISYQCYLASLVSSSQSCFLSLPPLHVCSPPTKTQHRGSSLYIQLIFSQTMQSNIFFSLAYATIFDFQGWKCVSFHLCRTWDMCRTCDNMRVKVGFSRAEHSRDHSSSWFCLRSPRIKEVYEDIWILDQYSHKTDFNRVQTTERNQQKFS